MTYRNHLAKDLAKAGVTGVAALLGQCTEEEAKKQFEALHRRLTEGLPELTIEGYSVKPEGIYNANGERIGDLLFVNGDGPGAPTALFTGLPMGEMHVVIKDKDPAAIMVALAWMGYQAEPGKGLEVADYIRRCWGGGTGPHSMLVDGINVAELISKDIDFVFGGAGGNA